MTLVTTLYWPRSRAGEGLELLARAAGYPVAPSVGQPAAQQSSLPDSLAAAAAAIGLEVEPIETSYADVDALLQSAGPAILSVENVGLVMLAGRRGRRARVVRPDHRVVWVPLAVLRNAIVESESAPLTAETERLVNDMDVPPSRRRKVVRAIVADRLRTRRLRAGWLVRLPPATAFAAQLVAAGARRRAILLAAAHAAQYGVWLASWWLLGRAALVGRLDRAWLSAWALTLATLVPLQLAVLWLQGTLALRTGALLKQRLLAGAFKLEPEEIRSEGAGQLLGRVIEAEAVESLALGGGLMAGLAGLELAMAAGILALVAPWLAALLLAWIAVTAAFTAVYFRRRFAWVELRIGLTHQLIERMLGHRTRLAQQPREQWHEGEDEALEGYVRSSVLMDRAAVWVLGFVPRGWMLAALVVLTPLFVGGVSAASLAVALGGILLAYRALDRLTNGLWSLSGAVIAWRQTAPVFRAAARGIPEAEPEARPHLTDATVAALTAADLRFTHAGRGQPVLRGCSLDIAPGERVILDGASGSGKSTLAAMLAGLRTPQSGLLLLDGLDRRTLGVAAWRQHVVLVPQFHENHVMLSSVAFNALMGGAWPPAEADFGRVDAVLRELGLGDTLDRMPSGLLQTIGETGWQLSHGERSRLYLARALLQNPDVLILDESFAQLDPDNMQRALDAVVARRSSVLLIAHP